MRREVKLPCGTKISSVSSVLKPQEYVRLRVEEGEGILPGTLTIDKGDLAYCADSVISSASKFFLNLRRDGLEQIIALLQETVNDERSVQSADDTK